MNNISEIPTKTIKKHPVYSNKLSSFALMEQETVVPAINKNTF